ncbi:hypothetical protein C8R41DRAFT_844995 [Lentinula lateritia]|uniref:Uncharacterized protein n=1 Tax=Lentinula lateritia TaxID=40482 RepID=A0ABQ8V7Y9_9AGAR|nr:hypothetical protein C8R41DRAFT_844995 [Lentinula lateritia]
MYMLRPKSTEKMPYNRSPNWFNTKHKSRRTASKFSSNKESISPYNSWKDYCGIQSLLEYYR